MKKKVLVIDDEPDLCRLIEAYLEHAGFQVWTATDPLEGLVILDRECPPLVLLDMRMPKMGGLDCLDRIKQRDPETVVVVLSGVQDEGTAKEAILRGAYDYITKPFNRTQFEQQILSRLYGS